MFIRHLLESVSWALLRVVKRGRAAQGSVVQESALLN